MKRMNLFTSLAGMLFFMFTIIPGEGYAQDCKAYFPNKVGTELTYKSYDSDDNMITRMVRKLVSVKDKADTTVYKVHQAVYDQNDEMINEGNLRFKCHDNKLFLDMQQFLNPQQMQQYEEADMKITMEEITLPGDLSPGMTLDDGFINMEVGSEFVNVDMKTRIYDRKVEAKETINTPAGSFDAYVISAKTKTKTPMMNTTTASKSWYNMDYGMVRSESYDEDNKLIRYMVLTKVEE